MLKSQILKLNDDDYIAKLAVRNISYLKKEKLFSQFLKTKKMIEK